MRDPSRRRNVDLQRTERVLALSGVGGAHSTAEVGESRWREGALVLGAFEEGENQEIGKPENSVNDSNPSKEAVPEGQECR